MAEFSIKEAKGRNELVIRGDITIADALQFRDAVYRLAKKRKDIYICCIELNQCDLTGIQIMFSTYQYVQNQKKKLYVSEEFAAVLTRMYTAAGLENHSFSTAEDHGYTQHGDQEVGI